MSAAAITAPATARAPTPKPLGLRLPRKAVPDAAWLPWAVVPRTKGWHVSRESANGARTQALTNAVGKTNIFRSHAAADLACLEANIAAMQAQGGVA